MPPRSLIVNLLLCLAIILIVLVTVSSRDVRHDPNYLVLYELLACTWLGASLILFSFLGISWRDDIVEHRNHGALWAIHGALPGVAACFAGSNIGNGPGPHAVIFCAILSTLTFIATWLLLDIAAAHWVDAITVDRNSASGLRFGSILFSAGLAYGSAVTGDWISASATLQDFLLRFWPIIPALCLSLLVERRLPRAPAAVYPGLTILCIWLERRSR